MMILGVDYHPSFQQIAFLDQETGECGEQRLNHSDGEAEKFYRELKQRGVSVLVGLEATGICQCLIKLSHLVAFVLQSRLHDLARGAVQHRQRLLASV